MPASNWPEYWSHASSFSAFFLFERLPDCYRTVEMLVDVEGYSYAEAAALLCVPVGTVRLRLSRARFALQRALWRQVTPGRRAVSEPERIGRESPPVPSRGHGLTSSVSRRTAFLISGHDLGPSVGKHCPERLERHLAQGQA
ncbi:RNA polymerase sigma factor [Thauera aromatica]|uniref:RNA polymerase sigma factor n=1 Tax=Thauera aromatica TaxID=59405 RepID=UPI001FFCA506|nr:RNA polymerase sigma factor [Thauera aromatica]MCK2096209.1 RNA polymerase sigma factor [Thauera aromatica]